VRGGDTRWWKVRSGRRCVRGWVGGGGGRCYVEVLQQGEHAKKKTKRKKGVEEGRWGASRVRTSYGGDCVGAL
jgi:hypothetical protein